MAPRDIKILDCYKSRCNFREDKFCHHFNRYSRKKQPEDNTSKTIQEVRGFGLAKPGNLDAIDAKDVLDGEKGMIFEAILLDSAGGATRAFLDASKRDLRKGDFAGENVVCKQKSCGNNEFPELSLVEISGIEPLTF